MTTYKSLYIKEKKREKERSAKLFMRLNCVMIVYGVEYFRARAFSLPHDGVKVIHASRTLLSFCVTTDELRQDKKHHVLPLFATGKNTEPTLTAV